MNKRILLRTAALFIAISFEARSIAEMTELPSLAPTEVYITNTSSQVTVNFSLVGDKCDPLSASLRPDYFGTYTCNGASSFEFAITTAKRDGSQVSRVATLAPTKRYEIYSEPSGAWNIREIYSR